MTKQPATIQHWLDTIDTEGHRLTKWETDFVDSIHEQWDERGSITDRQEEILERIYSEKTS